MRGERGCLRWRMRSCCRKSRISTSLSISVRPTNQARSSRIEQVCATKKKIMQTGVAGIVPTSEREARTKPVQVIQQDDDGFRRIFRTVRGHHQKFEQGSSKRA